jgi:coenzyme PQQ precursor peptide PqqA
MLDMPFGTLVVYVESRKRQSSMGRCSMVWTKPEFEMLELASEVTSYRYNR